jgi:hypothetical protein
MKGAILYGPYDVRFEERADPRIIEPMDAIIRMAATCVCGSDLWPYRGIEASRQPTPGALWAVATNIAASSKRSAVRSETSSPASSSLARFSLRTTPAPSVRRVIRADA